jgi:hypothetical protein
MKVEKSGGKKAKSAKIKTVSCYIYCMHMAYPESIIGFLIGMWTQPHFLDDPEE